MISRNTVLPVIAVSLLALAPLDASARHQVDIVELRLLHEGRAAASVPAGARVVIECRYRVSLDGGFPPPPALREWSGELSAAGQRLRVFDGELDEGMHVARAEWVAENAGNVAILCRLDRAGALRGVDGARVREVNLRVEAEVGEVVQCPRSLTAGLTATVAGARPAQGSIALELTHSRADGNVAACYYASRSLDVRDFRVELACRRAQRADTPSGTRSTADAGTHRYLCGAGS